MSQRNVEGWLLVSVLILFGIPTMGLAAIALWGLLFQTVRQVLGLG